MNDVIDVTALLNWYRVNARDLPWRRTRDPYRIMVSELMLQQTQAERVIPKYQEFLEAFPTLERLAVAATSDVIRSWAGLGYNRRALNLQRACQEVMERFGGVMPHDVADLKTLPGIGPYTAGAIACFAFEADVGFVDTNIRRVLHRVTRGPELPEPKLSPSEMQVLAEELVPDGLGYAWNQALIELGAVLCRSRSVACERCPLANGCVAKPTIRQVLTEARPRRRGNVERFETTSRYFRGRIVALLRDSEHGETSAALALAIKPETSNAAWIAPYLSSLTKDGLVVRTASGIREDSVSYDGEASADDIKFRLPD